MLKTTINAVKTWANKKFDLVEAYVNKKFADVDMAIDSVGLDIMGVAESINNKVDKPFVITAIQTDPYMSVLARETDIVFDKSFDEIAAAINDGLDIMVVLNNIGVRKIASSCYVDMGTISIYLKYIDELYAYSIEITIRTNNAARIFYYYDVLVDIDYNASYGTVPVKQSGGWVMYAYPADTPYDKNNSYKTNSIGKSMQAIENNLSHVLAGHTFELRNAREATCTLTGNSGDSYCATCNQKLLSGTISPSLGHSYNSGVVTTEATCANTGIKTYTCSRCGGTKTESIAMLEHIKERRNVKPATCTENGFNGDVYCSVCGKRLAGGVTTLALGHDWVVTAINKVATTTETGLKTFTCSRCGETKTEVIPVISSNHTHDYDIWFGRIEPTCTEDGKAADPYCSVCGRKMASGITLLAEHSWVTTQINKVATTTATGLKTMTCSVCGETKTEVIPVIPSNHTHDASLRIGAYDATCTENGFNGDAYCSVCGAKRGEGVAVRAIGHRYDVNGICLNCGKRLN